MFISVNTKMMSVCVCIYTYTHVYSKYIRTYTYVYAYIHTCQLIHTQRTQSRSNKSVYILRSDVINPVCNCSNEQIVARKLGVPGGFDRVSMGSWPSMFVNPPLS